MSDSIAGVISTETIERIITQATLHIRTRVVGRYNLAVIESGLAANTLQSITDLTAIKAALLLISRHNLGDNAANRIAGLQKELALSYDSIANGSLYYNDGTIVATRNAPSSVVTTESTSLGDLYADGDRYAQPSD